jgi:FixJ family two-component response regulator
MKPLKKILHIDDDSMMQMMVKKSIERSDKGFEIICCTTAAQFIGHLSTFEPDLLIIDVSMPILDGPHLLEKIRNIPNIAPAIFMTGHETVELEDQEKLEPIIGIIHKPFSPVSIGDDLLILWSAYLNR